MLGPAIRQYRRDQRDVAEGGVEWAAIHGPVLYHPLAQSDIVELIATRRLEPSDQVYDPARRVWIRAEENWGYEFFVREKHENEAEKERRATERKQLTSADRMEAYGDEKFAELLERLQHVEETIAATTARQVRTAELLWVETHKIFELLKAAAFAYVLWVVLDRFVF